MPLTKWEYLHVSGDTFDNAISNLSANGDDGWELINVYMEQREAMDTLSTLRYTYPFWHALYKRPIIPMITYKGKDNV